MSAVGWVLAAVGILLVPAGRVASAAAPLVPTTGRRRPTHLRHGVVVAAVALACVIVGGPVPGLTAALALCPTVVFAVRRLAALPVRRPPDPALPLVLDLTAAALRAGRPLPEALELAAPAAGAELAADLARVGALLGLGADPGPAWGALVANDPALDVVATAAIRSSRSGIKLADALEVVAAGLRADRATAAGARAQRAGVHAMGPLAACFLPSFVCLGVVPVIVGVAATVLGTIG